MVEVGFEVSIPSKLTVPVGKTCKLVWLGAVMLTVTFMTVTGLAVLSPPRLAMLQITSVLLPKFSAEDRCRAFRLQSREE